MNHNTAMQVAGDFVPHEGLDGDCFLLTPTADCPHLTAEIESWRERPVAKVVRVKERLTSLLHGEHLAECDGKTDNLAFKSFAGSSHH